MVWTHHPVQRLQIHEEAFRADYACVDELYQEDLRYERAFATFAAFEPCTSSFV